jgi:hypothetical protein
MFPLVVTAICKEIRIWFARTAAVYAPVAVAGHFVPLFEVLIKLAMKATSGNEAPAIGRGGCVTAKAMCRPIALSV